MNRLRLIPLLLALGGCLQGCGLQLVPYEDIKKTHGAAVAEKNGVFMEVDPRTKKMTLEASSDVSGALTAKGSANKKTGDITFDIGANLESKPSTTYQAITPLAQVLNEAMGMQLASMNVRQQMMNETRIKMQEQFWTGFNTALKTGVDGVKSYLSAVMPMLGAGGVETGIDIPALMALLSANAGGSAVIPTGNPP